MLACAVVRRCQQHVHSRVQACMLSLASPSLLWHRFTILCRESVNLQVCVCGVDCRSICCGYEGCAEKVLLWVCGGSPPATAPSATIGGTPASPAAAAISASPAAAAVPSAPAAATVPAPSARPPAASPAADTRSLLCSGRGGMEDGLVEGMSAVQPTSP